MTKSASIYATRDVLYEEVPEIQLASQEESDIKLDTEFLFPNNYTNQKDLFQEKFDYELFSALLFLLSDKFINTVKSKIRLNDDLSANQKFFLDESIRKLHTTIELDKEYFRKEMVEIPTERVINETQQLLTILAHNTLFPERIATSIEGGICLIFKNAQNKLYLEIYNSGDLGYIIEDSFRNKLVENEDLVSLFEASERITNFYR
jgi:hypothetical protein